ncbi:hypothetical protein AAFF_G00203630 [Aldrovandia affinis]|uniref:Uncharacterized protein n=1 Tax=Aldrovandia affinis TaxID=143900 RepID=A0AAD7WV51_9TELE|nr:hypothetical protein AAFF_G00203630 [Aldrovandia affinis]
MPNMPLTVFNLPSVAIDLFRAVPPNVCLSVAELLWVSKFNMSTATVELPKPEAPNIPQTVFNQPSVAMELPIAAAPPSLKYLVAMVVTDMLRVMNLPRVEVLQIHLVLLRWSLGTMGPSRVLAHSLSVVTIVTTAESRVRAPSKTWGKSNQFLSPMDSFGVEVPHPAVLHIFMAARNFNFHRADVLTPVKSSPSPTSVEPSRSTPGVIKLPRVTAFSSA